MRRGGRAPLGGPRLNGGAVFRLLRRLLVLRLLLELKQRRVRTEVRAGRQVVGGRVLDLLPLGLDEGGEVFAFDRRVRGLEQRLEAHVDGDLFWRHRPRLGERLCRGRLGHARRRGRLLGWTLAACTRCGDRSRAHTAATDAAGADADALWLGLADDAFDGGHLGRLREVLALHDLLDLRCELRVLADSLKKLWHRNPLRAHCLRVRCVGAAALAAENRSSASAQAGGSKVETISFRNCYVSVLFYWDKLS